MLLHSTAQWNIRWTLLTAPENSPLPLRLKDTDLSVIHWCLLSLHSCVDLLFLELFLLMKSQVFISRVQVQVCECWYHGWCHTLNLSGLCYHLTIYISLTSSALVVWSYFYLCFIYWGHLHYGSLCTNTNIRIPQVQPKMLESVLVSTWGYVLIQCHMIYLFEMGPSPLQQCCVHLYAT